LSYCKKDFDKLRPLGRLSPLSVTAANKQTKPNEMKSSDYYITRALRLARLPQSKNVARLRTANHRAMGDARRNELARLAIA